MNFFLMHIFVLEYCMEAFYTKSESIFFRFRLHVPVASHLSAVLKVSSLGFITVCVICLRSCFIPLSASIVWENLCIIVSLCLHQVSCSLKKTCLDPGPIRAPQESQETFSGYHGYFAFARARIRKPFDCTAACTNFRIRCQHDAF